jgi:hypothetical protein
LLLLPLSLAALVGAYCVASLLLLRTALPERYRVIVTEALGDALAFPRFHLWFDLVFLASALLAALAVGAHVLANEAYGHGGGAHSLHRRPPPTWSRGRDRPSSTPSTASAASRLTGANM